MRLFAHSISLLVLALTQAPAQDRHAPGIPDPGAFERTDSPSRAAAPWVLPGKGLTEQPAGAPPLRGPSGARPLSTDEPSGPARVEREAYLMGTLLDAAVGASDRQAGIAAIERAFSEVRRMEDLLSTWRDDTELARLNAAPVGRAFRASDELLSLLLEARRWSRETGSSFDPGVGPLIDAWDLRGAGRRPSGAELAHALAAAGIERFQIDPTSATVRRTREASWIDSGAFGKGAALREARRALLQSGIASAFLDFGGQVLAIGAPADAEAWTVAVAHPSRRRESAARLRLRDRSAATSSASERFVKVGGERFGHIVDPRTGRPVPAWGSVTVVAYDPLAADAVSTALFVLGPEGALQWARQRTDVGVLVLRETGHGLEAAWNRALDSAGVTLLESVKAANSMERVNADSMERVNAAKSKEE